MKLQTLGKLFACLALTLSLQGCLGTIVGGVVDVGIEVVKIPFKVGKAIVDVASDDDKKDKKDEGKDK
jgi:hypothetical protein